MSIKPNLNLRFHQEFLSQKTCNLIGDNNKHILWGCKCRSGKTYILGSLILKQSKIRNNLNVLIITPAPTETISQFVEDLFHKYQDFENFNIYNFKGSKDIENIQTSNQKNNIFVLSKQLLQRYIDDKTIIKIKNLNLDIIAFDEQHFSGNTDLSRSIITSYSTNNTVKIYLTATYNKSIRLWDIPTHCQLFWDIEDENICKSILKDNSNIDLLVEKHGYIIKETIGKLNQSLDQIFDPYKLMPEL